LKTQNTTKRPIGIVTKRDIVIPYVVLYEYLWVLLKLTNDVKFTKIKIEELKTFQLLHEDIDTIRTGLEILNKDGAPPRRQTTT